MRTAHPTMILISLNLLTLSQTWFVYLQQSKALNNQTSSPNTLIDFSFSKQKDSYSSVYKSLNTETDILSNSQRDSLRLKQSFATVAAFTIALWLIKIVETLIGVELYEYGIYPGKLSALMGAFLARLIQAQAREQVFPCHKDICPGLSLP